MIELPDILLNPARADHRAFLEEFERVMGRVKETQAETDEILARSRRSAETTLKPLSKIFEEKLERINQEYYGGCPKCRSKRFLRRYRTIDVQTRQSIRAVLCECGWTYKG